MPPIPPQRSDPRTSKRAHEAPQVDVAWERGLEDGHRWLGRPQGSRAQDAEGAPRDPIPEIRPLDQFVLGEAMQCAGQLLRVNAEPPPQSLERDLAGRVLREEFEDLAIVVTQVVEGRPRGGVHGGRYHRGPAQGGGSP